MGYKMTPPSDADDYIVEMFCTCRWVTFLKDGTEAEFEQDFDGLPTEEQIAEGRANVIAFARGAEVEEYTGQRAIQRAHA